MKRIKRFCLLHIVGCSLIALDVAYSIFYIVLMVLSSKGISSWSINDNLFSEIIGINLTVLIIDVAVNKRSERKELNYEFESDIQNYGRYLLNLKNKLDLIITLTEKNPKNDTLFLLKQELRLEIDNPPIRRSFSNKLITKERGERIVKSNSYASDVLSALDKSLSYDKTDSKEYSRIKGDLFRAALSILELRASNERVSELGSVLDRKMK